MVDVTRWLVPDTVSAGSIRTLILGTYGKCSRNGNNDYLLALERVGCELPGYGNQPASV